MLAKLQVRTADETLEEGLVAQVLVMLLEMLLGCCHELDRNELVPVHRVSSTTVWKPVGSIVNIPALLETHDDLSDESTLDTIRLDSDKSGLRQQLSSPLRIVEKCTHVRSELILASCAC